MRRLHYALIAAALACGATPLAGQQGQGTTPAPWPLSNAIRERGSSVTGAFEGWFYNKDGSQSFLVGYFNRNTKQELDIPVGPNNRIEPGGPDLGQPTHFLAGRQWGVFAIKVPKDFGTKELTWTIVANGQTNTITMHTRPDWIVQPYEDLANKNTPPVMVFERGGPSVLGAAGRHRGELHHDSRGEAAARGVGDRRGPEDQRAGHSTAQSARARIIGTGIPPGPAPRRQLVAASWTGCRHDRQSQAGDRGRGKDGGCGDVQCAR